MVNNFKHIYFVKYICIYMGRCVCIFMLDLSACLFGVITITTILQKMPVNN